VGFHAINLLELVMRYFCGVILLGLGLTAPALSVAESLPLFTAGSVSMPLEYEVDGVVEARRQATLSAEVAGKIESVNFDVDDKVEKGAVVIRIRDLEHRARLQKARAALAEARANLVEVKLRHERSEDLLKKKLIAQSAFDQVSAGLKAAQARVDSAQADLAQAEEQLDHTVVRAPYGGVVVQRHVEPGESIRPGQPIMTGYAPEHLRVSASVPQSIIASLRQRREARVLLLEDGSSLPVERITIHPFANPQNHGFPVRLDLSPGHRQLYPGMLVKVAVGIGEISRLLVPRQALVSRSEVNALYLQRTDGRLSFRQVRPGNQYGDRVEILAGLEAGEIVVLDPVRAAIELKRQQGEAQ
jgi:RND family efflux transporter MFP subunit